MADSPFELFDAWYAEAKASEPNDPNAMALATVDAALAADIGCSTGYLFDRGDPTAALAAAVHHGHRAVHPNELLVDEVLMAQASDHDLEVIVWTVEDQRRMADLIELGVDGLITNVPDVARVVVARSASGISEHPRLDEG